MANHIAEFGEYKSDLAHIGLEVTLAEVAL